MRARVSTRDDCKNPLCLATTVINSGREVSSTTPAPLVSFLLSSSMWVWSRWGSMRREGSEIHLPCTHICTMCINLRVVDSQPSLAEMSTRDYNIRRKSSIPRVNIRAIIYMYSRTSIIRPSIIRNFGMAIFSKMDVSTAVTMDTGMFIFCACADAHMHCCLSI